MFRAQQAVFLAVEADDQHAVLWGLALQFGGEGQHGGHARGIVVGPVVDQPFLGADMVIMGGDHDIFVRHPRAGDQADDIDAVPGFAPALGLPRLKAPDRWRDHTQGVQRPTI